MKIAIAQMNPVIGALKHNAQRALALAERAALLGAELIIFPELYLSGYPPKDLLLRSDFLKSVQREALQFAQKTPIAALLGAPYGRSAEKLAFNTALFLEAGKISIAAQKILLPNYNIFDEKRYFSPGLDQKCARFTYKNKNFLISICEDAWASKPEFLAINYGFDPVENAFNEFKNIDYFINMSASPYAHDKPAKREELFRHIAQKYKIPVLVAGQVGGNDQLIFDGHSLVINAQGDIISRAQACEEDLLIFDTQKSAAEKKILPAYSYFPDALKLKHKALVMAIRDYTKKCGAKGLVIGLSGGIDSAVCASLAVEALGKERVRAFYLPSKYSSEHSSQDAHSLALNLGLLLEVVPIEKAVEILRECLKSLFSQASVKNQDLGDQNIQARLRGLVLMGAANALDYYMICTANKSELAVGYGTLYGDMCGAFSPLGDMYKSEVWDLARTINAQKILIPEAIINKAPSAELKANQLDADSLPDYALLDQILSNYIDLDLSADEIQVKTGLDILLIKHVINLVKTSEYKRRQAPMAFMLSSRVFGDARRMPIAEGE